MDTTRNTGKLSTIKPMLSSAMSTMSSKMNVVRKNPAVITGVAGAVAVAAGIAGRMLRRRIYHTKRPAGFILIEA